MVNKEEEETKENQTPQPVSMAKKYMLIDLGVPKEELKELTTNEEADELIAYMEKKNAKDPEIQQLREKSKLKPNAGHQAATLTQAEEIAGSNLKLNMRDKWDKISPRYAETVDGVKFNGDCVIMAVFDDDYPEGRCF